MNFLAKKLKIKTLSILVCAPLIYGGHYLLLQYNPQPIVFQSAESKTREGGPVFNRIRFLQEDGKDIWMMQQSHQGLTPDFDSWDRLAIVINKTKSPKQAKFFQLESGQLNWEEIPKSKEFRVSCFVCHPNGPRVIRPAAVTNEANLSLWDSARIKIWNMRIKSYGRVVYDPSHDDIDKDSRVPFRLRSHIENDVLTVSTCSQCHRDAGFFARGSLRRQNALTIAFMISEGHMPPLWFHLPASDRKSIEAFLNGF